MISNILKDITENNTRRTGMRNNVSNESKSFFHYSLRRSTGSEKIKKMCMGALTNEIDHILLRDIKQDLHVKQMVACNEKRVLYDNRKRLA